MQAGYLVDLRALQVLLQANFDALRIDSAKKSTKAST
jgi:hypothetical protein